jgi:hypothetical protein
MMERYEYMRVPYFLTLSSSQFLSKPQVSETSCLLQPDLQTSSARGRRGVIAAVAQQQQSFFVLWGPGLKY